MKISPYILSIYLGFLACAHNTNSKILVEEKIRGNWKTEYFKDSGEKTALIFSFQDSTCSYLYPWGEYSKYWINRDTLNIKERFRQGRSDISAGQIVYKFLIDSITSESLTIRPITSQTKGLFKYYKELNFENIRLSKIIERYDWETERIGFYSTGCYGTCPSMYLEIDNVGNIFFSGDHHTEKKGRYSGKLSSQELKNIKSEINSIALDKLDKMYSANWTDDQTCGIMIKTIDETYESSAYGFDREPVELRVLFHRLMEVYKAADMEQDPTAAKNFLLQGFEFSGRPLPPPPPLRVKK